MTVKDLATLTPSGYPAVSLLMPTHRTPPENQQDPIRLRNLLAEAKRRLDEDECLQRRGIVPGPDHQADQQREEDEDADDAGEAALDRGEEPVDHRAAPLARGRSEGRARRIPSCSRRVARFS